MKKNEMEKMRVGDRVFIYNRAKKKIESGWLGQSRHLGKVSVQVNNKMRYVSPKDLFRSHVAATQVLEEDRYREMLKKYGS